MSTLIRNGKAAARAQPDKAARPAHPAAATRVAGRSTASGGKHASDRLYRRLIAAAVAITFGLLMLGAWVRLTDAGLGCPDWPGCYGHLTPSHAADRIAAAVAEQGGEHGPVSMGKAWREMLHRYVASSLGLLIVAIAVLAWRRRGVTSRSQSARNMSTATATATSTSALASAPSPTLASGSPWLPTALVGVVVLQGLFGMWTVTLLLKPAIVTGHLIGGMLVLALLVWLWQREGAAPRHRHAAPVARLQGVAAAALAVVACQIVLGGWVSTNYAALACTDLPTCQGAWLPPMNFADAFHVRRELGYTGDGQLLPLAALTAIHWTHRLGAVVVLLVAGLAGWRALATDERPLGLAILAALAAQWALGLSNVLFGLPLPVAVAHNGGAALLLGLLVVMNFRAARARLGS